MDATLLRAFAADRIAGLLRYAFGRSADGGTQFSLCGGEPFGETADLSCLAA